MFDKSSYNRQYYLENKVRHLSNMSAYRQEHKDEIRQYTRDHSSSRNKYCQEYWNINKDTLSVKGSEYRYTRRLQSKRDALAYYSKGTYTCADCGFKGDEFTLTLDHIQDDGCLHKQEQRYKQSFYIWVVKNNYPKGFQVLCHNCNYGVVLKRKPLPFRVGMNF